MVADPAELYARADMIIKVKEPQPCEYPLLRRDQIVFTYFHFAADRELTEAVLRSGCTAVAYETLRDDRGRLPLLTPMSEVAGRMSIQEGAKYLERPQMGRGILLGGVPGVEPAHVTILGGGVVGMQRRQNRRRLPGPRHDSRRRHGSAPLSRRHHAGQCGSPLSATGIPSARNCRTRTC